MNDNRDAELQERYTEQRGCRRRSYSAAFQYALHGDCIKTFQPGISVNISETGLAILVEEELEPGQVIVLRDMEDGRDMKIAVVKWSMRTGKQYKTGLMFIS